MQRAADDPLRHRHAALHRSRHHRAPRVGREGPVAGRALAGRGGRRPHAAPDPRGARRRRRHLAGRLRRRGAAGPLRGAAAHRRDHGRPRGSSPSPGSTCRSGRSRWRRCTPGERLQPRARRRGLAARRHGHARAMGPRRRARGRRRRGDDPWSPSSRGRARAMDQPDVNLALEPRDTLSWTGAPVMAAAPAGRRVPANAASALRRPRALGADGGRPRVPPRPDGAVRERAQAVRPAHRELPGHPAQPGAARRSHRGGGHRRGERVPRRRARRRGLRDRGGQGPRPARRPASARASRTSATAPSASPTSTRCTSSRAGSGRGARSSAPRPLGRAPGPRRGAPRRRRALVASHVAMILAEYGHRHGPLQSHRSAFA